MISVYRKDDLFNKCAVTCKTVTDLCIMTILKTLTL